jgi:hypothetical protein
MSQVESKSESKTTVETTVDYLPATQPFHKPYPQATTLQVVRTEAMQHFGVSDHTDRDRHEFHLEFEGQRVDYSRTLAQLLGEHRKGVHLDLVEQVTAGAV